MEVVDMSQLPLHVFWILQEVAEMEWWPWEVHHQARSISCLPARSMVMTVFSHSANVLMAFSHISHRLSIPILISSPTTNYYRDKSWSPTNKYKAVTFNLGWNLFSKLRVFSFYPWIDKIIRKSRFVTWRKVLWSLNLEYLENPWTLKFYIWEPQTTSSDRWSDKPQSIDVIMMEDLTHQFYLYLAFFFLFWMVNVSLFPFMNQLY